MLLALGLLLGARALAADPGSIHLDLGGRAAVWDADHRIGLGAGLGLSLAAGSMAEIEARLGYAYIPARLDVPGAGSLDLGLGELALYYAPYRSLFRPMIGGHVGMARVGDAWRWNLGMDATALFCVNDRVQLYGIAIPSLLLKEGTGEAWLRVGAGVRLALRL